MLMGTVFGAVGTCGQRCTSTRRLIVHETVFDKVIDVNQNLIASNNIYPITYKVMKDGSGNWLIVNIIVNGVNLGLTFRNQFQALAIEHNGDIEEVTNNWISNAEI